MRSEPGEISGRRKPEGLVADEIIGACLGGEMNSKGPSGQADRKWGPREGVWAGEEDSGGLEAGWKPWVGKRWSIERKRRDQ